MEAATNTIQQLTQRVLPDNPHFLAYHPDWRYKPQNDRHPDKPTEWHNIRLQYMTLVSDADRGLLLTRPSYDMVEELQKPVPREVTALSKGPEKKKLSLSDYKNKKTSGGTASASPPDPAVARRREADSRDKASPRPAPEARNQRPVNGSHPLERTPSHGTSESKLPARPPTIHPLPRKPPSPEPRKRTPYPDDDSRLLKRTRPDADRSDRPRPPRDEPPRRSKDQPPTGHTPQREPRSAPASSLSNGGSRLKDSRASAKNGPSPPTSHSRNSSLNGTRPSQAPSGSNRDTSLRNEANPKSFVPPLLSPLRLGSDSRPSEDRERKTKKETPADRDRDRSDRDLDRGRDRERDREKDRDRERGRDRDRDRDRERDKDRERERERQRDRERENERDRKREKAPDLDRSVDRPKASKPEKAEPKSEKRPSPPPIPPLLDPTLDPEVEEAYQNWAKYHMASSDEEQEDLPHRAKTKRKEPLSISGSTKKRPVADISEDESVGANQQTERKSFLISLRVAKGLRKDFGRMMKMSDARQERRERQERSQQSPPHDSAPARKRPAVAEEAAKDESTASKRPRISDAVTAHAREPPATPGKKMGTAMSRVSSSNSHANTPGDPYPTPTHADVNGSASSGARPPPPSRADQEKAERSFAQEAHLQAIGKKLKHAAQGMWSKDPGTDRRQKEADDRFGCVKYLEAIIVFTLSFYARDKGRALLRSHPIPQSWMGIVPMLDVLHSQIRRVDERPRRTLQALAHIIHRAAIDEWIRQTAKLAEPDLRELAKSVSQKERATEQLRAIMTDAGSRQDRGELQQGGGGGGGVLKGVDISVWMSVEDVCQAALRVMGRWCQDQEVDWKPKNLKPEAK